FWDALSRVGVDYTDLGTLRGLGNFRLNIGVLDSFRQVYLQFGDYTGGTSQQSLQVLRYAAARFHGGKAEAAAQRWIAAGARTPNIFELWYEIFEFLWYDPMVPAVDVTRLPLDAHFADLQASVLRSSWQPGGLVVGFKAGPFGGR